MIRKLAALVLVLALTFAPTVNAAPARDSKAQRAARAQFQKGEKAFNLGRFQDALTAYEGAFDAVPLTGFLFNIAQCHRNLGRHERALFFYRRYLAVDRDTANRALVEELIAEEEQAIAEQVRKIKQREVSLALARTPESLLPQPPKDERSIVAEPAPPPKPSFVRANWMWLGLGGVVVAGAATAMLMGRGGSTLPGSRLEPWDLR